MRTLLLVALSLALAWPAGGQGEAYPTPPDKKGLQVQELDDALALGIHHAGLNVDLGALLESDPAAPALEWEHEGRPYRFRRGAVEALDAAIRPLSERGVVVTLILLAIASGDAQRDRLLLHPAYDPAAPNRMGAWNTETPEGRAWYAAVLGFLAQRWSGAEAPHGRVWNWIVGNEVNSHWWWFNRGHASLAEVVASYESAVRVAHAALRSASREARVFVSLEHHWTLRFAAGDATQAFPGRDFLLAFAARVRERGDFDWHVAFHPYPENLFDCRFWNDRSAPDADDAGRVTFRNLPVLVRFLARDELRFRGAPRRVILSEQGFHCADGESGERDQAAALAAAWWLVEHTVGIDAFLLHRHVDHAHEGGLRLGLWTRKPDSISTPDRPRLAHEVFRAMGTPSFPEVARFALEVVGVERWEDLAELGAPRDERR